MAILKTDCDTLVRNTDVNSDGETPVRDTDVEILTLGILISSYRGEHSNST